MTDLIANIGDYNGGSGGTPGVYPTQTHATLVGPLDGGAFALTHEGGSAGVADATRYLSTLPAGGSVTVYWLVSYPQTDVNNVPTWGTSVKPDDDLALRYDVWATATESSSTRSVAVSRTLTCRNEISASANKIYPNGANKVPDYYKTLLNQYVPSWTNVFADGSVGTRITTEGIWYDFGNVGEGFDNNGDLIPDRNAWMQPVGNPDLFDAGAFRLVKTYAMVVVKLKTGGEQVLTGEDKLYFENIPLNNGAVGYVRYEFVPLVAGARSVTSPYQEVASGYDNEKYNADYGVLLGSEALVSGTANVLLDLTASVSTVAAGGTIVYDAAYTNAGTVSAGDPDAGVPLVIQETIPEGTVYVAGSATLRTVLPSGVSGVHVLYSVDNGATWTTAEPSTASDVTDIQWWLDSALPADAWGSVGFTVTVDNPYERSTPEVDDTAALSFGNGATFAEDSVTTLVLGQNTISGVVYGDTGVGVGGYFGNGIRDGSEPGLPGVTVTLYADLDGDGEADADESSVASVQTASNGTYTFSGLTDGRYMVVVEASDAGLPTGYTATTASSVAVDLDSAYASSSAVNVSATGFGFAPALAVSKIRVGSGTLREGQTAIYRLTVTNALPGDGTGVATAAHYSVWPTNGVSGTGGNKSFINPTNAWHAVEPDALYATAPFNNAGENLTVNGYYLGPQLGSPTNVVLLLPLRVNGSFAGNASTLQVIVYLNGTQIGSQTYACSALATGTLSDDITSYQTAWNWTNFNGSALSVDLVTKKSGNPGASIDVDSVGFKVTTGVSVGLASASTTLDPVPLDDVFDPARLRFVSATVSPDSVSTNGVSGTLHWDNLGPLYAGGWHSVNVTFAVLQPPRNTSAWLTNTAFVTGAAFLNGVAANDGVSRVVDNVLPAGTIGDRVWRDLDADGVQDAGESGVPGVTVRLTPPSGVDLGGGTNQPITAVTDAEGYYLFAGLPASGTYTVAVVTSSLPGTTNTPTYDYDGIATANSAAVPIVYNSTNGADTVLSADFGYTLQSLVCGSLWHDRDRDGSASREDGEEALSNVTVRLYAANGSTLLATTNTAADGSYRFAGAYSGAYVVKVDKSVGLFASGTWVESFDTDATNTANQVTVSVTSGNVALADFSYYLLGALVIGDTLFYDWDGDGVQDAGTDAGIAGVTVRLYQDESTNGVVDAGVDALVASATTGTNGTYTFTGLPSGTYLVIVDPADAHLPSNWLVTADPYGAKDGRSVVTLTTANNLSQDFGYQPYGFNTVGGTTWFDADADGAQDGYTEVGLSNVTVRLFADLGGTGTYTLIRTAATAADGTYAFDELPDGDYRVSVVTNSAGVPTDSLGSAYRPTTTTVRDVSVSGGETVSSVDFGFAPLGAIGDTVFWDSNANGGQDWNEQGISGVRMFLYADANANGVYDTGETLVASTVTDSDGRYLFSGLSQGDYVVAVDTSSSVLSGATLTADPEMDGEPCPIPAVEGTGCDAQTGVGIVPGEIFVGADFGYRPTGVIGGLLWADANTNSVCDDGERGLGYVTVLLYQGSTLVATNVTDADGVYVFDNLSNATYRVSVDLTDEDISSGLTVSWDCDGTPDGTIQDVVLSAGHITAVGGNSFTNGDTELNVGFHFAGDNVLSGTVGLDTAPYDGVLNGTNTTGTGTGEYPFKDALVYLYLWTDGGDGVIGSGETVLVASTATDSNGDYRFTGLPSGGTNAYYVVAMGAPADDLRLTTETGDTPAIRVHNETNTLGVTRSAYQVAAIKSAVSGIDFAFGSTLSCDFGDLPSSYSTTVADQPVGPSHGIVDGVSLYLGAGVSAESNGKPTADASGDTDDDGVVVSGPWREGSGGGVVTVTVGAGSGWLAGWVDFDQDGTFADTNEWVIGQSVSSATNGGVYTIQFDIPANTFKTNGTTVLNARFRLYPSEPYVTTYFGPADAGEVEDYQFVFGMIGDRVWEDLNGNGLQDAGEPGVSNAVVRLYGPDSAWVRSVTTETDGSYAFTGLPTNRYSVVFTAPSNMTFTVCDAGGDDQSDSDADASGAVVNIALSNGVPYRLDVDAGVYQKACVYGYLFADRNGDLLRDSGDATVTNALVRLVSGSNVVSTSTDETGYYWFGGVVPGTVTVLVSNAGSSLCAVPTDEPAASDPARNRALSDATGVDAYIAYAVTSGYGTTEALPGETLNVGYAETSLSTEIDVKLYASGDGTVSIEIRTVDESGTDDIVVYAWIDNAWVEVGRVASSEVVGEGSNVYTVTASGLSAGGSYYLRIVDESGHVHDSAAPVAVGGITVESIRLDMQTARVTFTTEPGCRYVVKVCGELSANADDWTAEYVSRLKGTVWTSYSDQSFMAGTGTCTTVRIPVNRQKAFFKIVRVAD